MKKRKDFLSVSHVDKNGERHHLFDISESDGVFKIDFTENTKRFFPKAFTNEQFKDGYTNNLDSINTFLKFYLPKEMRHLVTLDSDPIMSLTRASNFLITPIALSNGPDEKIASKKIPVNRILKECSKDDPDYNEKCQHNKNVLDDLQILYKGLITSENEIRFPAIMENKDGTFKKVTVTTHHKQDHTDKLELHSQFVLNQSLKQYNQENIYNKDLGISDVDIFNTSDGRVYSFEDSVHSNYFKMQPSNLKNGDDCFLYDENAMKSDLHFTADSLAYLYTGKDISNLDYDGHTTINRFYQNFNEKANGKSVPKYNVGNLNNLAMFSLSIGSLREEQYFKINIDKDRAVNLFEPSKATNLKFNTKGTNSEKHILNNISLSSLDQTTVSDKFDRGESHWAKNMLSDSNHSWVEARSMMVNLRKTLDRLDKKEIVQKSVIHSINDYFNVKNKKNMTPNDYYNYERSVNTFNEKLDLKYGNNNDVIIDNKRTHGIKSKAKIT